MKAKSEDARNDAARVTVVGNRLVDDVVDAGEDFATAASSSGSAPAGGTGWFMSTCDSELSANWSRASGGRLSTSKSPNEGNSAERSGSNGRAGEGERDRTSDENVSGRSP